MQLRVCHYALDEMISWQHLFYFSHSRCISGPTTRFGRLSILGLAFIVLFVGAMGVFRSLGCRPRDNEHTKSSCSAIAQARTKVLQTEDANDTVFGGFTEVFVISLPHRQDRRKDMRELADTLDFHFTFFDAFGAEDPVVSSVIERVKVLRVHSLTIARSAKALANLGYTVNIPLTIHPDEGISFEWPQDFLGPNTWTQPIYGPHNAAIDLPPAVLPSESSESSSNILACATENMVVPSPRSELKPYETLDLPKIACWHSHLQVIQRIAYGNDTGPVLVLEDDIDMESDIDERLSALWGSLPHDWDIVYLGHCWSNETLHPALRLVAPPFSNTHVHAQQLGENGTALHISVSPKCTHAYALSRTGARRLVSHLRYPPFAYSRAIDQAMAGLIRDARLRAFSIVPPVVIQRKVLESDVMPGKGSAWRDRLYNSVLG